jgi:MOSC domain-containing protein YiiM
MMVEDMGLQGDVHAVAGSQKQVSFLCKTKIDEFSHKGIDLEPGAFGENIIVDTFEGIDVKPGDVLFLGDNVEVKVTIIGKECIEPCIIQKKIGSCIMPEYGIFGIVVKGGLIHVGDSCRYSQ